MSVKSRAKKKQRDNGNRFSECVFFHVFFFTFNTPPLSYDFENSDRIFAAQEWALLGLHYETCGRLTRITAPAEQAHGHDLLESRQMGPMSCWALSIHVVHPEDRELGFGP